MRNAEQTVLVQGASRGIGLALVQQFLADPMVERVIATSRRPSESEGLGALAARHGDSLALVPLDVCDETSLALAHRTLAERGVERLHALVNCAGLLHEGPLLKPEKRLEDLSIEKFQRSFAVNAFGPALVARELFPLLRHDERAIVANLSARVGSIADNRAGGWYAYRASKAAQNQLTRTLALEFRRRAKNVICVALHPGTVDTDLSLPFQRNVPPEKLFDPSRAAIQLIEVMNGCTTEQSGQFLAWDGSEIPW